MRTYYAFRYKYLVFQSKGKLGFSDFWFYSFFVSSRNKIERVYANADALRERLFWRPQAPHMYFIGQAPGQHFPVSSYISTPSQEGK